MNMSASMNSACSECMSEFVKAVGVKMSEYKDECKDIGGYL